MMHHRLLFLLILLGLFVCPDGTAVELSPIGSFQSRAGSIDLLSRKALAGGYPVSFAQETDRAAKPAEVAERGIFGDMAYAGRAFVEDAAHIFSSPARIDTRSALWFGGILAVGGVIYAYDQEIYDAFRRSRDDGLFRDIRKLGESFEKYGDGGMMAKYYVGALGAAYIIGWDPLLYATADMAESYYIAGGIKNATNLFMGRGRPHEGEGPYYFRFNEGTSLPSGHMANLIQMANISAHHINFLPYTIAAYTITGAVGIQRVTSDNHWPSDVYFAAIYGWLVSETLVERNEARRRVKVVPTAAANGEGLGLVLLYRF